MVFRVKMAKKCKLTGKTTKQKHLNVSVTPEEIKKAPSVRQIVFSKARGRMTGWTPEEYTKV